MCIIITELQDNEILVYSSNTLGIANTLISLLAHKFGAKTGYGNGPKGKTYAIPVQDHSLRSLPIERIEYYVNRFISYAKANPELLFLVCEMNEFARLFSSAIDISNIVFLKDS